MTHYEFIAEKSTNTTLARTESIVKFKVDGTLIGTATSSMSYGSAGTGTVTLNGINTIDESYVVDCGTYVLKDGDTITVPRPYDVFQRESSGALYVSYLTLGTGTPSCGMSSGFPPTQYKISPSDVEPDPKPNQPDFSVIGGWKPVQVPDSKSTGTSKGVLTNGTSAISVGSLTENTCYYPCWGAGQSAPYSSLYYRALRVKFITDSGAKIRVKVNGEWKEAKPKVKVSGEWKDVKKAYVNVAGTWKETK